MAAAATKDLWVVGFVRPYRVRADINTWFDDPEIFDLVQREFARGGYQGIGEFHLNGKAADTAWVKKLVAFAARNHLWLHAHADEEALAILYRHHPQARIVWAHTGFSTSPAQVAVLLDRHPTLIGELSYRHGLTDEAGRLTPEWRALFERHPGRFLLGSDTWINERWESYGRTMAGYRQWLAQLPPAVADRLRGRRQSAYFGNELAAFAIAGMADQKKQTLTVEVRGANSPRRKAPLSTGRLERTLSEPCAIRVDCLFISSRRVVLLLVVHFVKQDAMNSHCIVLGNPTSPYASKCLVKFFFRTTSHDFINKGDILSFRENKVELFFSCLKDVVDRVFGAVDDLDIFHTL